MNNPTGPNPAKQSGSEGDVAFKLWQHYSETGGKDKNWMVQIGTWLWGISSAILVYMVKEHIADLRCMDPPMALFLAATGFLFALVAAKVVLLYGGYASRNWAIADAIAYDQGWRFALPDYEREIWAKEPRSKLMRHALHLSKPCSTDQELAPVFLIYFWVALTLCTVHALIALVAFVRIICECR